VPVPGVVVTAADPDSRLRVVGRVGGLAGRAPLLLDPDGDVVDWYGTGDTQESGGCSRSDPPQREPSIVMNVDAWATLWVTPWQRYGQRSGATVAGQDGPR
jgi:hypothetical protein